VPGILRRPIRFRHSFIRGLLVEGIRVVSFAFALALLVLLAACSVPRPGAAFLPPGHTLLAAPTATPTLTPGPSETPAPTLCAHARVSGQTCIAHVEVLISSCCPEWSANTWADEVGAFEFDNLTAGTFTVSAGGRSREITLKYCDSQFSVNLCPQPTHPPLGH
jgi:hypothetical protein